MRPAKVRPIMDQLDWPELGMSETEPGWQHGHHRQDYLARQAFLRSYRFTVKESLPEKVKKKLAEIGESAVEFIRRVRDEVHLALVRLKAPRRLGLPSSGRCFRHI